MVVPDYYLHASLKAFVAWGCNAALGAAPAVLYCVVVPSHKSFAENF